VAGRAILPTVMGLDRLIRAVGSSPEGGAAIVVEDVEVGPPVIVDSTPVILRATADRHESGGWTCGLSSAGGDAHFTARVRTVVQRPPHRLPNQRGDDHGIGADHVYPPFFHGPTFRVVSQFARTDAGFVVRLNEGLPTLSWSSGQLQTRARLLELVMQGCGLLALADSGRLMIPSGIARLTWYRAALRPPSGRDSPALAWITDRGDDSYDGYVVDASGEVLLDVVGYRSTDLGRPPDLAGANALRQKLSPIEGAPR
jgi:hypothetical protein